jgi:hypothetical protein
MPSSQNNDGFLLSGDAVQKSNSLMMAVILTLGLTLGLAACNLPRAAPMPATLPATPPTVPQTCGFTWATQPLPDLSRQVQDAMNKAGLKGVTVRAEAYGENCIDAQTNKVDSFAAMETDFKISTEVRDLKDLETLGNQLERILTVLDQFPPDSTPGPQPGYIGIRFFSGNEELNLWFLTQDGKAARDEGLRGRALLERLQRK